ncbi:MAG: iron ABC transporter permease, partial [Hydrogenophaga sp.]|uniref:hypothetical protein n=1 Tax=Hydrogenophaga sp. TaxID=1904254 RepID=UPI00169F1E4D
TPLMFDFDRVTPVQIFLGLNDMAVSRRPYALTAVMLAAAAGAYVLGRLVLRGRGLEVQTRATRAAPTRILQGWQA